MLLVLLPVCSLLVFASIAAVDDFRTAARLRDFRSATRLSVASGEAAAALADERTAATLHRLGARSFDRRRTAAAQRAVDAALRRAAPDAHHGAGAVDVAGSLDALRRRLNALRLQAASGSLGFQEIVEDYGVLIRGLSGLVRDLDSAQPTLATGRAANAYVALVRALEGAEQERVTVAAALLRGLRSVRVRGVLVEADALDDFRHFGAGHLVADLSTLLLKPAGLTVQRVRDLLVRDPARIRRQISLEQWLSAAGTRIGALRRLEHDAADELATTNSADLDAARVGAWRTVAASITVLVLLVGLGLVLLRSITQPLGEVAEAARMLSTGRLASGVTYTGRDEIGEVATAFRDVQSTTDRLAGEIRAMNVAVEHNELDHRADAAAFAGTWGELVGGMNDTMAAFAELQGLRERAERQADRIFEFSHDLLCIAGFDGYFKRVNPAFTRLLGYSEETLLSRPTREFVHPDDRAARDDGHGGLEAGEDVRRFDLRQLCRDGSVRLVEWSARVVRDERLIYAVGRDVTDIRRAADQQAALRRVATLVAKSAAPEEIFAAVACEVRALFEAASATVVRFDSDGSTIVVGAASDGSDGSHADGVVATDQPPVDVRLDPVPSMPGAAVLLGAENRRSCAATPILLMGRIWGQIAVFAQHGPLPADAEERLADFTELVATAIANADARAELTASRARIVASADETRRKIERDLHDGAQQRLISIALQIRAVQENLPPDGNGPTAELDRVVAGLTDALDELREFASGIHPAILREGGIEAALKVLARRCTVQVELTVRLQERPPEALEIAAYYLVSEALANATKHAQAERVIVDVEERNDGLLVVVKDDGVGGATFGHGSGLVGLRDRVEALGGRIALDSAPGIGTKLTAELPLAVSR